MALDKVLKIYDENGNPVDYDILASDVKFLPDGKDLPNKLAEMEEEIGEGGYTPPAGGIPKADLAPSVQTSLGLADTALQSDDKTQLQNAINSLQSTLDTLIGSGNVQGAIDTFNEVKAFLEGISSSDTLAAKLATLVPQSRTINEKPLTSNIVLGINDIDGLAAAIAAAGNGAVSVIQPDPADGTFIIRVGETDYTINLNHTHPNMAKLIVCEESDLPSTLDNSTIYAITDSGETEIEKLIIHGMEFAGGGYAPGTPAITSPGSTVNLGANDGSGVTGSIRVKGNSYITGALTVTVASNSGLSLTYGQQTGSQVTIAQADAITGVQIDVTYSGSGALELADGLVVSGGGATPKSVVVVVELPRPVELTAIKTTGTQYFDLGYTPNPNTKFEFDVKFEKNSITDSSTAANNCCPFLSAPENSGKYFIFQTGLGNAELYSLMAYTNTTNPFTKTNYGNEATFCQRGTIEYENGSLAFLGRTQTPATMNHTAGGTLLLGYGTNKSRIFDVFNMYVYGLKIYEGSTLLHEFKPVTYQGTPGLYDEVNDRFISSASGTDPIAIE